MEQGIPVIAVRENRNIMRNDLTTLPWADGQFHLVENYWEAAGVLAAIKAGIAPESVRRPLPHTVVRRSGAVMPHKVGPLDAEPHALRSSPRSAT